MAVVTAALALAGCSNGTGTSAGPTAATSAAAGTSVQVALSEWSVSPTPTSVPAGDITFEVTNNGPEDPHEFVIVKTDLDFAALPTDDSGTVDEAGEGMEVIGEIEDIPVGETQELTETLSAGAYVLLCNIYEETEQESHYQEGMRIPFTVE
jgi:uncharacterized cupredoxin-like copper-binding protein